jgi:peptide/nickel transport system substrate-binding protein
LPKHLLEHVPVAKLGNYREFNVDRPIGAGPFKLASWTAGDNLVFDAFDGYFEGRPYLDRITGRVIPNGSAGVLSLETGEVDVMLAPIGEVPIIERMRQVTLHRVPVAGYEYVGWNLRNELFADRRVRQALTHAVDRQEIVDALFGGHATVAHAAVPPAMAWAYTDDVPKFPYDPERAKELLREAGWLPGADGVLTRNGRRFSFELLSDEGSGFRTDIAVILQQALGRVGVEVKPAQMEFGAFLARIDPPSFDFEAYMTAVIHPSDPDPAAIWHSREIERGLNNVAFRHPRVDELADRNTRLLDRAERAAVLNELWQIIAEEQPYLFLFYAENAVAIRDDVRGYTPHPLVLTEAAHRWWLDRAAASTP